nr:patatin-like phospholipase family protein [Trinickia terrae]
MAASPGPVSSQSRVRRAAALAFFFAAAFASRDAAAESVCTIAGDAHRPSVGLVLSGGGARGYAHLGVLKVLEENRIPVDCIAGTSMGAVVGGLYASGMSAAEMEKRLENVNLADIAFDVSERAELPQSEREDERLYVGSLGFGPNGVKLPAGLVQGNRFRALLQDWTSSVPGNQPFDKLPIPYRAIATNLRTGEKVVLDHGSLPQAIRASMALPGLFAPTDVDGVTLVDGGLVSNLPIETAREMGANVVIAVDIGSPLRPLDALSSPADVMQQTLGILIHQNVARQRAQLAASDVLIEPQLGPLSFTDFANARAAIAAGEAAARAALPKLQALALPPEAYAEYRSAHAALPRVPIRVTSVVVETNGEVPPARILDHLHVKAGDVYDPAKVNQDLRELTTSGDFESVTQQLITEGEGHRLVIDAREKSWGPNFLLFGLGMSSSSKDQGGFRVNLGYRRPWLTPSGLEWRVDSILGSELLSFHTELRQPLSTSFGYYVAPYAEVQRHFANIYDNDTGFRLNQYHVQTERAGFDFGVPLARLGDFRIGLAYAHGYAGPVYNAFDDAGINSEAYPKFYGRQVTARARLVIDQLDDPLFPRRGYFAEARGERTVFGGSDKFTELYGKSIVAESFGRQSVSASLEAGADIGGVNVVNPFGFTLGGFQHLSAYAADQLSGNSLLYGQVTYLDQLMSFNIAPLRALFAGVSLEAGNVWDQGDRFGSGKLRRSVTFFTSATSSFGPLYVGIAFAPGGRRNIYFQLGHTY